MASLPPAVLSAESKLIRVGQGGSVDEATLPSCASLRTFAQVSPQSREKGRRFWTTIARAYHEEYRRKVAAYSDAAARIRKSSQEAYQIAMTSLVRQRRTQGQPFRATLSEVEAMRQDFGRRERQQQAQLRENVGAEQQRADAAFVAAQKALIASLPWQDRRAAEIAMLPLAPSAGTCR